MVISRRFHCGRDFGVGATTVGGSGAGLCVAPGEGRCDCIGPTLTGGSAVWV
jgi:hypothetical protein